MRKLTIGMATYDDYDGIYFTIQSIRLYHPEILKDVEFIVIDNNPKGTHAPYIKDLIDNINEPIQYLPYTNCKSTSIKNKIFDLAETPYVLCVDCHILIVPGAIQRLIRFFEEEKDGGNLLQGPIVLNNLQNVYTHFDLSEWGSYMWGKWAKDDRGTELTSEPFEIPAQGLGLFACRKNSWLRFNPHFRGFGGEEGYIHEKYRMKGKKTLCLPFLRWLHRFGRPNGIPYPNTLDDRFRNYLIGHMELGLDMSELIRQFPNQATKENISSICSEVFTKVPKKPPL